MKQSVFEEDRRQFLVRTGLLLGGSALANATPSAPLPDKLDTWEAVRAQFELNPKLIHLAGFYLASHPKPVREAIANYRRLLDENPFGYLSQNSVAREAAVLQAVANYLKTVRNSSEHFSFFILPFSFFREGENFSLAKNEEGKMKKEK
jgi:hypothetical protein